MAAILKIQDGRHIYIWQIGNMGFLIAHTTKFPKMYRFASLPKMPTKLHCELDYWAKRQFRENLICGYSAYSKYHMAPKNLLLVITSVELYQLI